MKQQMHPFSTARAVIAGVLLGVAPTLLAQQAVLYTGSDWLESSEALQAAWESPEMAAAAGVTLSVVDAPEVVDDDIKAMWKAQEGIAWDLDAFPGFAYFDAKGRCVLLRQSLPALEDKEALELLKGLVAEGKAREQKVEELLSQGTAEGAGQVLAMLVPELGIRRSREGRGIKAAWDLLKAKDPEDKSGWEFALTFDVANQACYHVQGLVRQKKAKEAEDYIKELEAKLQPKVPINQHQGIKLLRYIVWKDNPKAQAKIEPLLREVVAMGAETHYGIAAMGLLCLRNAGPVAVPYGWRPQHAQAGDQAWRLEVGVKPFITAPGAYTLTLRRGKGQGKMQVKGLKLGTKTFGEPAELAAGKEHTITFEVLPETLACVPELLVNFENPAEESGGLWLRQVLPARVETEKRPVDPRATPWQQRRGESVVAKYARHVIPEAAYAEISGQPGGADFLKAFFGDMEWQEAFFGSGEPETSWDTALRALDRIAYHSDLDTPALRRWATAAALNAEKDITDTVLLFQAMMELRAAKHFVRGADRQRVDQMRAVIVPWLLTPASARYLTAEHCKPPRDYHGVCWYAPYRTDNYFGESIQGSSYFPPWEHGYPRTRSWASVEPSRKVGGVCGALSYYGSAAAKAHGIPSVPAGQPAHCAYAVWSATENRWTLAYNVNPYSWAHYSLWKGRGAYSWLELAAATYAQPGMHESMRRLWRTELAVAAAPKGYSEKLARAFREAAKPAPLNYLVWKQYGEWLAKCDNAPVAAWNAYGDAVAKAFADHLEPGWNILQAYALPALKKLGGKPVVKAALTRWHGTLRQGPQRTDEFCNYGRLLDELAKAVDNDDEALFEPYTAMLKRQYGTRDAFGRVVQWGGARFLAKPELARRYVGALTELLQSKGGEEVDVTGFLRGALTNASQQRNAEAFHALADLADRLNPPPELKPLDRKGITAPLLSDKGLLRLSTTSRWNLPEHYRRLLDNTEPAGDLICHTAREERPWAEVILPGMAEVSAVRVVNRGEQWERLVPFVIEVSEDGEKWRKVASTNEQKGEYVFTFRPTRAKHVRLMCTPAEGGKTFLHVRKLAIFGKKLY